MTFVELLKKNAENYNGKAAIIYHNSKITYKELNDTVNRMANALLDYGLKKGDRVGIMLPRVPELVISFLAASNAGCIAAPLNFELLYDRIRAIMENISPKCFIVHKQFLELAKKSIPQDSEAIVIVVGEECGEKAFSWEEMLKGESPIASPLDIDENDVVYLNYTSGSTGNSKGAVTTYSNIHWNTMAAVDALKLTHDDVHLCMFAPFAHPHEIFARPLYLGGTMVLVDKIYPKSLAEAIAGNRVTCMMGLAPMYENLLELLGHKDYDLSSLKIPESGGMHTRLDLIEKFRDRVGVNIVPVWGSTETTGIAIANNTEEVIPGSIGKPCLSYEAKIIDEDNKEVGDGEIGEMVFKGPAVVKGYYDDSVSSEVAFKKGWYHSGDLGKKDNDGNFYFVDRKTGMMKVAGLKVYPMEIELALIEHPDIKEAAVISSKDRLRGEVPKAIVVAKNGKRLTEKEVLEFCRERLPQYKLPKIIEIREALPKIGSGKINKKELQMEHT